MTLAIPSLAVIPARGGSKGLPGKNKKELHGKSLTQWALEFASKYRFDSICVSSDDQEILDIADSVHKVYKVVRPNELSGDTVSDQPVLRHALKEMESRTGLLYGRLVMLQPTSPGRDLEEFKEAMLRHSNTLNPLTSSIWSVVPVPHQFHAHKQIVALPNLYLNRENVKPPRRQNLPPSYVRNGDFYILGRHVLDDPYLAGKQLDVFQSKYPAINIDTAEDFRNAERLLTAEGLSLAKREEKF